jgi:Spy/CpxP family protein refolding chaperone
MEAFAAKLGLSDQQKEQISKIHADFATKTGPLHRQLATLHREQREAMSKVLTEEQRAKAKEIFKAAREEKWQATAAKLKLSDEQKQRVEKIRAEYAKRFQDLAAQKTEGRRDQFRTLRHEQYQAIGRELTEEQRAEFRDMARKMFHHRRDAQPAARVAFWKAIGEKLGVTPEQKEQFKKIRAEYASKKEKPAAELKELRQERHAAMAKVLTEEQRAKLQEMRKARKKDEKKQDVNGKD